MARVLHGIPVGTLPEPGELDPKDQIIAYRQSDGQSYRTDVNNLVSEGTDLINRVYPIGSIYMSVSETNPADLFGGSWRQIKDCFLLSAGDSHNAGETGGAETVSLSSSQIPSHTHSIPSLSGTAASAGSHTHGLYYFQNHTQSGSNQSQYFSQGDHTVSGSNAMASAGAHTHSVTTNSSTTGSTGSGSAHNNMPPYMAVYVWQRIA